MEIADDTDDEQVLPAQGPPAQGPYEGVWTELSGQTKQQPSFNSDMQQLITWGPSFKNVMQQLTAEGHTDLHLKVVDDQNVRISFGGKTAVTAIESAPSQGPPAKGKGKRKYDHNKITTQYDSTKDGDTMDANIKRKKESGEWLTGYAACQMCGELWVCDGRIEKPNHIHPLHISRMFHFVCPSDDCTKNPLLACKSGRPVYP